MTPVINFFDSIGNSLINSAELAIRTDEYSSRFEPPSGLELYILDEENKFIMIGNTFKTVRDERTANRESLVMNFVKDEYSNQGSYSGFITILYPGAPEQSK